MRKSFPPAGSHEDATGGLYLIAILPPPALAEEIKQVKRDFANDYGAVYALRTLPHITLQPPFKWSPGHEAVMREKLVFFAAMQRPFHLSVSGFGSFPHPGNKVIFLKVTENEGLQRLHRNLALYLRQSLGFRMLDTKVAFQPHITIAYRDLTTQQYEKAWPRYRHRTFAGDFAVDSFFLLKHNGKHWETACECRLGPAKGGVSPEPPAFSF